MMYIFDANVFINFIRAEEDTLKEVDCFIYKLIYNDIKVLIPDLCFYEVIYNLKKKEKVNEKTIELIDLFLSLENLIIYKLDAKEYKTILNLSVLNNTSTYD
ncbi:PIN domain-containing protein [bacterium]|nr:PIN domain-containing protein [bacterium]